MTIRWMDSALMAAWSCLPWMLSRLVLSSRATWRRRQERVRALWVAWVVLSLLFPFRTWLVDQVGWFVFYLAALLTLWIASFVSRRVRVCEDCKAVNLGVLLTP